MKTFLALAFLALGLGACTRANPNAGLLDDLGERGGDGGLPDLAGGGDGGGADLAEPCVPTGAETCDGVDNDCNGLVDDGISGAGVACGGMAAVGGCVEKTACVPGVGVVCLGTFVSPAGAANAPGTLAAPVDSIARAIEHARLIGGGADVCVCDPPGNAPTSYAEDVTMVEGVSVLGGYDCSFTQRDPAQSVVRILPQDPAKGVHFPPGTTAQTALDGVSVRGPDNVGGTSVAISVADASPTLKNVIVQGGGAGVSAGLYVVRSAGGTARPTIEGGSYAANGATGGIEVAVSLDNGASASFTNVEIANPGIGQTPNVSIGLGCGGMGATPGCPGTTVTGGRIEGGPATTSSVGLYADGNVAGLSVTGTTRIRGGAVSGGSAASVGISLDDCTGASTFTNNADVRGATGTMGVRIGVAAKGAACAPTISGGVVRGCETGASCIGVVCDGAPCVVQKAQVSAASTNTALLGVGIRCVNGGCSAITGSTVSAAEVLANSSSSTGIGVDVDGASPKLEANLVTGPSCNVMGGSSGAGILQAVRLKASSSQVVNNVLRDAQCNAPAAVVQIEPDATRSPTLHSNTLVYGGSPFGPRAGVALVYAGGAMVSGGVLRNNLVTTPAKQSSTAIFDSSSNAAFAAIENNDLDDAVVYQAGATSYATISAMEMAIPGAAKNISDVPLFDGARPYHLTSVSPCRDAGTAAGAPAADRDGDARPNGAAHDIGADEYVP